MKTLVLVISFLFLLIGCGFAALTYNLDGDDHADATEIAVKLDEYRASYASADEATKAKAEELLPDQLKDAPSPARIQIGSFMALTVLALALGLMVVAFAKRELVKPLFIGITALALLTIVVHPAIDKGEYGGQSGRTGAMIMAAFTIVGALGVVYARKPAELHTA